MEDLKLILDIAYYVIAILGVPVAIFLYFKEKARERREREYGTYNALDDKYIDYLKLCLDNPDLDIYYIEKMKPEKMSPEQKNKEKIVFEILICILERAFLMYQDQSTTIKKEQWEGWNDYMKDWMQRNNFRRNWEIMGHQWESNFTKHMNMIQANIEKANNLDLK